MSDSLPDGSSGPPEQSGDRDDVRWALLDVVAPVLRHMFRPHEIDDARVSSTVGEDGGVTLTLWMHALGHSGAAVLWDSTSSLRDSPIADLRVRAAAPRHDCGEPCGMGRI